MKIQYIIFFSKHLWNFKPFRSKTYSKCFSFESFSINKLQITVSIRAPLNGHTYRVSLSVFNNLDTPISNKDWVICFLTFEANFCHIRKKKKKHALVWDLKTKKHNYYILSHSRNYEILNHNCYIKSRNPLIIIMTTEIVHYGITIRLFRS